MSRLETRVRKLEDATGNAPDMSGYDDRWNYVRHHLYFCDTNGKDVTSINLFAEGAEQYRFDAEGELWKIFPPGTKFLRSGGGDYEVIDGVIRELHFPPSDGKLSPEIQKAFDLVTRCDE